MYWARFFAEQLRSGDVLGEVFRGTAAERPHGARVVPSQSLLPPLISGGKSACNSPQGISNDELGSLQFYRFMPFGDGGSAGIACDF